MLRLRRLRMLHRGAISHLPDLDSLRPLKTCLRSAALRASQNQPATLKFVSRFGFQHRAGTENFSRRETVDSLARFRLAQWLKGCCTAMPWLQRTMGTSLDRVRPGLSGTPKK